MLFSLYFLLIFVNIFNKCNGIEFKIFDDLIQVRSQNGLFFPLCSTSFTKTYGEQACSTISASFSTFTITPLNQYAYSVGCTSSICFSFLSSFCKTGVRIFCSPSRCAPGTTQLGSKCLKVSENLVDNYSEAKDYCSPFKMISLNKSSDIDLIIETILPSDHKTFHYYTSGLRKGSKWLWDDSLIDQQFKIDTENAENGRCLTINILEKRLEPTDCEKSAFVICEVGLECLQRGKQYLGTANVSSEGYPCIRWDDPSILLQHQNDESPPIFSHNFCRFVTLPEKTQSLLPMCYIKPNQLQECEISTCPESLNDDVRQIGDSTCPSGSFPCDNFSKCISEKFHCDYEVDCNDGTDEQNCEDYLQNYELVGAYRIIENVIEVWTFIPHVQGCARKCRESLLICEAFSYEPKSQVCLLSDKSQSYSKLAPTFTSLYYRRRFSSKDVIFTVENNVLYANKKTKKGQICNENFSREKLSSICRILGFGDSIYTTSSHQFDESSQQSLMSPPTSSLLTSSKKTTSKLSLTSSPTSSLISQNEFRLSRKQQQPQQQQLKQLNTSRSHFSILPLHRHSWNLTCLRNSDCETTQLSTCQPIRCSFCAESACSDGKCIRFDQLCNGISDCSSNDDESACSSHTFRLVNGSENGGFVEVLFRSKWKSVCSSSEEGIDVNSICEIIGLGNVGILTETHRNITNGWNILNCENQQCQIRQSENCEKQLKILCQTSIDHNTNNQQSSQCGIRYVEINARDAIRSRYARVVGGFETVHGAFPWTAAIRIKKTKSHHCGASILDRTFLITAAHCFEDDQRVESYEIVVGDWDNNQTDGSEQIFDLQRIYFYPLYKDIFAHDIAIIELDAPGIEFNQYIQPICLPNRNFIYTPGKQCVVSGWGSTGLHYANRLQAARIPIIDRFDCMNSSEIYQSMSRSAFCAGYLEGGVDSCQGDSGGPFACRRNDDGAFILAGVISWGDGCAQKKQPGIYTMVAPYLTWIQQIIRSDDGDSTALF